MTDDLLARLRSLADPQYGLARGFDDAQDTLNQAADRIEQLEARIAAIDALHWCEYDESDRGWCKSDGLPWPCQTHRIIHEGTP